MIRIHIQRSCICCIECSLRILFHKSVRKLQVTDDADYDSKNKKQNNNSRYAFKNNA